MTTKIYIPIKKMESVFFRFRNGGNDKTATIKPLNECGVKTVKVTAHKKTTASTMEGTGKFTIEVTHSDGDIARFSNFIPNISTQDKTVGISIRSAGETIPYVEIIGI